MKKILTLILLSPAAAFAQSDSGMFAGGLVAFVFSILIALAIFLVIRGLMLWYWKVDKIVNNLEQQSNTLNAILRRMEERGDNLGSNQDAQS